MCEVYEATSWNVVVVAGSASVTTRAMASLKQKRRELELFPLVAERIYIRAIRELMEQGHYNNFDSPEQCFQWWISNDNAHAWLNKQRQNTLF